MRSTLPKVLHRVGGRTFLETVLEKAESLPPSQIVVVLGASRGQIEPLLAGRQVAIVAQDPARGTGDAVRQALPSLESAQAPVLILSGDLPLVRVETLRALLERQREARLDLALLSFRPPDVQGMDRVLRDRSGRVRKIRQAGGAGPRETRSTEANAGIYCFRPDALRRALSHLIENPISGEIELFDVVEILVRRGGRVEAVEASDWREAWGVDTRRQLAGAEEIEHRRGIDRALDAGATLIDPSTTRIGPLVTVEPDTVIHPFVLLEGRTVLSSGCEIQAFTRINDSHVAPLAVIGPHCDVEGARIGKRARVGPFARLRPGTVLEEDVRVGNFVETKEAVLGPGVKALHHSYLGDTEIGAQANIGAGVITCNYDGRTKNRTVIGAGAFVGSDSQLIAPVTVGEGAYVGAGSTITQDVPPGALALSRVPQKNDEGWVERRREKPVRKREGGENR
jgi:bifunctional UDP-N-acetylglucosamine pyrophosphorylase / glucosamine-1-phosphate N-acetyltransferase